MNKIQRQLILETFTAIADMCVTPNIVAGEKNPTVKQKKKRKSKALVTVKK